MGVLGLYEPFGFIGIARYQPRSSQLARGCCGRIFLVSGLSPTARIRARLSMRIASGRRPGRSLLGEVGSFVDHGDREGEPAAATPFSFLDR